MAAPSGTTWSSFSSSFLSSFCSFRQLDVSSCDSLGNIEGLLMERDKQQNLLSDPSTLPLVRNLIQFINNKECIPQLFNRWTDKFGPIFVIRIGQVDAIVINTMDLIREAFSVRAMVFSDRPSSLPLIKKIYQGKGLAWQSGDQWKQLRHAARKALKCCGVGNQSLEERILFEVEKLINELSIAEASGDALDPSEVLHEAVTDILCSAIFGCRYKYGSKRMRSLVQMIHCNLSNCNIFHSANILQFVSTKCHMDFASVLSHKDGNKHCVLAPADCKNSDENRSLEDISCATENAKLILGFINEEIERHREDFDSNNLRDFIDEYLSTSLGGRCKKKPLHRQNIEATILDLFSYGTEPTSVVLRWVILCLLEYREVQQKCHDEIDQQMNRAEDDDHEIRVLIHQSHAGRVIGKGGTRIKEQREETGSQIKIYMDCAPYSSERVVQITGSARQITGCIGAMYETMEGVPPKGANMPYNPNNFDQFNSTSYGGYTDDRGGRRGPRDMRISGANSGLAGGLGGFGGGSGRFGDMSNCGGSSMGGMSSYMHSRTGGNTDKVTTSQVSIPKGLAGAILGKGGNRIKQVQSESGTKIKLDDASPDSAERIISITGTQEQIQYAQYLLQMTVKRHSGASP